MRGLNVHATLFTQVDDLLFLKRAEMMPMEAFLATAEASFAISTSIGNANTLTRVGDVKQFTLINHRKTQN